MGIVEVLRLCPLFQSVPFFEATVLIHLRKQLTKYLLPHGTDLTLEVPFKLLSRDLYSFQVVSGSDPADKPLQGPSQFPQ